MPGREGGLGGGVAFGHDGLCDCTASACRSVRVRQVSSAIPRLFNRYSGTLLAADESPRVSSKTVGIAKKAVLTPFLDELTFRAWSESDVYQTISIGRRAGSGAVVRLVNGLG
ncbi:DUF1330 domain-containing protein [Mycobacteroides salmoniphilum]|uniref:DUF1330 domain-containing protein n=1 Tax=Mycobacteroides salmoniphilum TaxID=404941 RepID=UPI002D21A728|nr:DUF1330 domain-containing protein [Mycobacteroides salmoniphilum]